MKTINFSNEQLENIKINATSLYKKGGSYSGEVMFNEHWHDVIIKLCEQAKNDTKTENVA
jgi:hypothetical protein